MPASAEGSSGAGDWRPISALRFTSDGLGIVAAAPEHLVRLYSTDDGHVIREFACESDVLAVTLSPDERLMAAGDMAGWVSIFNFATGEIQFRVQLHLMWIWDLVFSADGRHPSALSCSAIWRTVRFRCESSSTRVSSLG